MPSFHLIRFIILSRTHMVQAIKTIVFIVFLAVLTDSALLTTITVPAGYSYLSRQ